MKYVIGAILMLMTATASSAIDFTNLDWERDLKGDNLTVYVADVPDSDIKAFKAISIYDATIEQLVSAITDMDRFTTWVDGAAQAKVLKTEDNAQWCYYENHVPFPYKNRDGIIVQRVVKLTDDEVVIELGADNTIEPPKKGLVRITDLTGAWRLKNVGEGKVELTYQVHLDPTGVLPSWVVNLMLTGTPKATLRNLHKLDLSVYQSAPALYVSQ